MWSRLADGDVPIPAAHPGRCLSVGVTPLVEQAGAATGLLHLSSIPTRFRIRRPQPTALQLREHRGLLTFHDSNKSPSCPFCRALHPLCTCQRASWRGCEHTCSMLGRSHRTVYVQRGCQHLLRRPCLMRVSRASAETHLTVMNQSHHRNIDMQPMAHSHRKKKARTWRSHEMLFSISAASPDFGEISRLYAAIPCGRLKISVSKF